MRKTIQFLRSESFIFIAIIFVMVGQIFHTAYLFENLRRMDLSFSANGQRVDVFNWVHAVVCASAIEVAILLSILNGKKIAAQVYAVGSFATNILYYAYWDASIPVIMSSTLVSGMLSGSIWFFSDLFARRVHLYDEEHSAKLSEQKSEKELEDAYGGSTTGGIKTVGPFLKSST